MSAFLCSNDTISAITTYWDRHRNGATPAGRLTSAITWALESVDLACDRGDIVADELIRVHRGADRAVFHILLAENVKSLKARYPGCDDMWAESESYVYKRSASVHRWLHCMPHGHGNLVGLVNGYSYQSCEHDEWPHSIAYHLIEQVKHSLLRDLESRDCKDDTQWATFQEPSAAPLVVNLSDLVKR
jgi:hypothetical protein